MNSNVIKVDTTDNFPKYTKPLNTDKYSSILQEYHHIFIE